MSGEGEARRDSLLRKETAFGKKAINNDDLGNRER